MTRLPGQPRDAPLRHSRFASFRHRLEAFAPPPGLPSWLYELALFVFKQGWACLFGALLLALLLWQRTCVTPPTHRSPATTS